MAQKYTTEDALQDIIDNDDADAAAQALLEAVYDDMIPSRELEDQDAETQE